MNTPVIDYKNCYVVAHRVIVKVIQPEEFTKVGSIILAEKVISKQLEGHEMGEVINFGRTAMDFEGLQPLEIGDVVVFKKHAGCDVTQKNAEDVVKKIEEKKDEYRAINDEDVLLILKDKLKIKEVPTNA